MVIAVDAIYENGVLKPKGSLDLPERTEVHLTIESSAGGARTDLGRELRALRAQIVESGAPLLGWEQISEEVAQRRGGWHEGE